MNMKDLFIEKILRENLPNQLEFSGEFGSEIALFIPFLRFLDRYDCLLDRKIITYSGMEIFYRASQLPIPDIKYEKRKFLYSHELMPWLPIWNIHSYNNGIKSIFHDFPNYRNYFESIDLDVNSYFKDERPLIIIFNKVVEEWSSFPINYFDANDLTQIFNTLKEKYNLIYCHHDLIKINKKEYSEDHNEKPNKVNKLKRIKSKFVNRKIFSERSNILNVLNKQSSNNFITIQSIYNDPKIKSKYTYNELQCKLISLSNDFISIQGGGSLLLAAFGDCNLHILHKRGSEYPDSYFKGYYRFIAPKPANIFVYKQKSELIKSLINFYK